MSAAFILTALTRDPALARALDAAGVDRVGVDVERLGKRDRQGHVPDARISDHTLDDLRGVAAALPRALPFARLDPLHAGSADQVEAALHAGARVVMLPWFTRAAEAAALAALVRGRARVALLIETRAAAERIDEVAAVPGADELFVGLNDLHRDLGLAHPFAVLVHPVMARLSAAARAAGKPFGFGGVARFDDPDLPVPGDLVLAQYARHRARGAWLARAFLRAVPAPALGREVARLRARLDWWTRQPADALLAASDALARHPLVRGPHPLPV